jgi:hypothetical protein
LPLPSQPVLQAVSCWTVAGRRGRGSALGWRLWADVAVASCMALVGSWTHLWIASFTAGFSWSSCSGQAWNVAQSILVDSGLSGSSWKDGRQEMSIKIGGWS